MDASTESASISLNLVFLQLELVSTIGPERKRVQNSAYVAWLQYAAMYSLLLLLFYMYFCVCLYVLL